MKRLLAFGCLVAILSGTFVAHVDAQILDSRNELYELVLIPTDLKEASRQMTIYDPNEDGVVDVGERERLPWKAAWKDFDLNRDSKLTHLEIAVRQAKLRLQDDITEFDVNNVQSFLARYDSNRNGQLDPDEIDKGGWPDTPEDYDANGDGTLTLREMAAQFAFNRGLRREMGIEAVDNVGASRWIRQFDKDGDKKLNAEEREGMRLPKSASEFDDDGDDKLGQMELATMLAKHRADAGLTKPDVRKIQGIFGRYDSDGDGEIDISGVSNGVVEGAVGEPFRAAPMQGIVRYDTNKDGTVTIQEVEAVVAGERKKRGYTEREFDKAKRMLTRHDLNRSRFIDPAELFENASEGKLPKTLIEKADKNSDGKVGLDELARYFAIQDGN